MYHQKILESNFLKDLSTIKNIDDIKWFFNSTSGINNISELKTMVKNVLKKADDELEKLFDEEGKFSRKISKTFKTTINNSSDLLQAISNSDNFNKIFEIVK